MTYTYGWNVPGYMPEAEPMEADTISEARESLLWEIERWDESDDATSEQFDHAAECLRNLTEKAPAYVQCGRYVLFIEEIPS